MRPSIQGFTLVELLISITLGATILLATTSLFIEGRNSFLYQSQWRELHERGRHLMQFFTAELHKAGYPKSSFSGAALSGTDSDSSGDTLTIRYQDAKDCAGSSSSSVQYALENTELRCDGNGDSSPTPQTLTSHIEGMQIRYGIDSDGDESIESYANATAVTDWNSIQSITISLLLRSEQAVRESSDSETYTLLGVEHGPFNDHYLRKVYQTTVQLRNR